MPEPCGMRILRVLAYIAIVLTFVSGAIWIIRGTKGSNYNWGMMNWGMLSWVAAMVAFFGIENQQRKGVFINQATINN